MLARTLSRAGLATAAAPALALALTLGVTPAAHAATLTASDGAAGDQFGRSVSGSGTTGLVGAYRHEISPNDLQGAAYVFRNIDTATGTVYESVKLTASDGAAYDIFGYSVSLSGTTGLVGARYDDDAGGDSGSAYVFRNLDTATGTINENVKLTASDGAASDWFGSSVSLSGASGLIGAWGDDMPLTNRQGSAYVFRNLDTAIGTVNENAKLTASDGASSDHFGFSVSLSGTTGLVGASGDNLGSFANHGSAYVFRNLDTATGTIFENAKLIASDGTGGEYLGEAVSLSGAIGLAGAYRDDVGANTDQGSAYVFRNLDTATGTVTEHVKLIASDGAAEDEFGRSVSLSGTTGLVGARLDDDEGFRSGSAYLFRNLDSVTGTVNQNVKLTASDGAGNDSFGTSVSLSGDRFIIGADGKNSATGQAYFGTVSSVTTLDEGSASRTIDGISFISQDDWIIGQNTDANEVTLLAGNTGDVTAAGKSVHVGQNAGSDSNTLTIAGTLTANEVNVGATGNTGNELIVNGAINGGVEVTVASGSTLSGTGTITGNVTNAGTVAPGNSPGVLDIDGNLTSTDTIAFELDGLTVGSDHDQLNVTGTVDLAGTLDILLGFTPTAGDSFQIMTFGSLVDNGYSFDFSNAGLTPGLAWDTSNFALDGTIGVVPEPTTLALLGVGGLALLRRRRA